MRSIVVKGCVQHVSNPCVFGVIESQEARVNWAFQKEQKEEVANHFHVFVGDLSSGALRRVWC